MQMKRNIKFKLNDLIIVLLCVAASFVFVSAFWQEYSRTLTKLNETPVGTITFKKRTAQRKFIDRVVWDMLKPSSPVYNGDTIRTIEASEAVITFRDEAAHITMNANTLIQIFYNDKDGAKIDFSGGNLEVNSGAASITITSGSSEIVVQGQASLDKKDEGFALSVLSGEVVYDGEKIEKGEILFFDEQGERDIKPAIQVISLSTSTKIPSTPEETSPVDFEWSTFNFRDGTFVIIETSLDPSFKNIVHTANVTDSTDVSITIESGSAAEGRVYFWRAYPAAAGTREPANPMYPSGTLEIIPTSFSAADVNKIFYNRNIWIPDNQGADEALANKVTTDWQIGKEKLQGQEKDVFTMTVNIPESESKEWRQGLFNTANNSILRRLKTAAGIRFKMLADSGRGWQLLVLTSTVKDVGYYEVNLPVGDGQVVEVDIPYTRLRQPEWANPVRFNRNNITAFEIRRHVNGWEPGQPISGSSTIKIFDFEIYSESDMRPAAVTNQIFYNRNIWIPFKDGTSEAIKNRVALDYRTGKENIQGQQKDVLTMTVGLPVLESETYEWGQGGIDMTDGFILHRLKTASGIRFKVLGDSGRRWQIQVQTSTVKDSCYHEFEIPVTNGEAVQVDMPYTRLRQGDWGNQVRFDRNAIKCLQIKRSAGSWDTGQAFSGSSTIKIFDFEIY